MIATSNQTLAERVTTLELDIALMQRTGPSIEPGDRLIAAAEVALARLQEFRAAHACQITEEPEDNPDYVDVCSPIAALEKALVPYRKK